MKPGVRGRDVDEAQRRLMEKNGSDTVMWSTGHPVGYVAHDTGPNLGGSRGVSLRPAALKPLKAGMVFSFDGFHAWTLEVVAEEDRSVEEMAVVHEGRRRIPDAARRTGVDWSLAGLVFQQGNQRQRFVAIRAADLRLRHEVATGCGIICWPQMRLAVVYRIEIDAGHAGRFTLRHAGYGPMIEGAMQQAPQPGRRYSIVGRVAGNSSNLFGNRLTLGLAPGLYAWRCGRRAVRPIHGTAVCYPGSRRGQFRAPAAGTASQGDQHR